MIAHGRAPSRPGAAPRTPGELSALILDATADYYDVDDTRRRDQLRRRQAGASSHGGSTMTGRATTETPRDNAATRWRSSSSTAAPRDRDLRNELVEEHMRLAEFLARRFAHRGEPLDDLRQVALVGLLKAVERFEPDRGLQFSSFAMPTILGELKRHFRDRGWAVRVPATRAGAAPRARPHRSPT